MGRAYWHTIPLAAALLATGCKKDAPLDASTPRGAALLFSRALESGDLATARAASNAGGYERELLDSMAESASAMQHLTNIAIARLGDEGKKIAEQHGAVSIARQLIDGDVEQKGDIAYVKTKDGAQVQLKRIDGKWRVDVGALTGGRDVSALMPLLQSAALSARQVADEIESGRITKLTEAQNAMFTRIIADMPPQGRARLVSPSVPSTTNPTTTSTAPASSS